MNRISTKTFEALKNTDYYLVSSLPFQKRKLSYSSLLSSITISTGCFRSFASVVSLEL
jgi:hypothetical protein